MTPPKVAIWLTAKRLRAHGLILALCLWSVYLWNKAAPGLLDRAGNLKGTDFLHFYTLGSLALAHRSADLYNMKAQAQLAAERIPAAAGIFVWLYWLDPVPGWRVAIERLRERRFCISAAILGAALAVCYITLRPAPDGATPDNDIAGASWLDYLMIGTGRLWSYFVPFIPEMLRGSLR